MVEEDIMQQAGGGNNKQENGRKETRRRKESMSISDPFATPDDPNFPTNFLRQDSILIRKKAGESFSVYSPEILVLPKERLDPSLGTLGELRHHSRTGTKSHVKKFVRKNAWCTGHRVRAELWKELCRNSAFTANMRIYKEAKASLKDNYRPSILNSSLTVLNDWQLNADGKKDLLRVLTEVEIIRPDVTCIPVLYSLTALLLHYMGAEETFACIMHLLGEKQKFLMQTDVTISASKRTLVTLIKRHAHSSYLLLKKLLGTNDEDTLMMVFNGWKNWLFRDLPFAHACRMVDCFINEGQKVLFRYAVVVVQQWHKHDHGKYHGSAGPVRRPEEIHEQISIFCKNMPIQPQHLLKLAFHLRNLKMSHIRKLQDRNRDLELQKRKGHMEIGRKASSHNMKAMLATHQFSKLQLDSHILTSDEFVVMEAWFPPIVQLKNPKRIFCSLKDGISFVRLWQKLDEYSPTLFMIETNNDEILGAFCSGCWLDRGNATYFGTGESFLFTIKPDLICYPWVGKDCPRVAHNQELFLNAENTTLIIGGGSGHGICIRDSLVKGRTEACDTFANPPLAEFNSFEIKKFEVFAFVEEGEEEEDETIENETEIRGYENAVENATKNRGFF